MPGPYTCPVLSFTTKTNKVDLVDAAHINAVQTEIAAINNRMLNAIDSDGTILSGTAFPSPATLTSQQFWRTDLNVLYIWTGSSWSPQSGTISNTAGDYPLNINPLGDVAASTSSTSYALLHSIYIPRPGVLRIKALYKSTAGDTAAIRIYRNGAAVGTETTTTSTSYQEYSEDISGWSVGDILQLYGKVNPGTGMSAGGIRLYTGVPNTEVMLTTDRVPHKVWTGSVDPTGSGLTSYGDRGDFWVRPDGGASTTLYVKTAASTWTAK